MRSGCRYRLLLLSSVWLGFGFAARAANTTPPDPTNENVQEAIERADDLMQPGAAHEDRTIHRRQDLEQILSQIAQDSTTNVLFYEVEPRPGGKAGDDFVWAAVPDGSRNGAYQLYDFDGSEGFSGVSQEFNRLAAQLKLAISDEQAIPLGQFFIRCCVPGGPSELITDDDSLRHSVERYYLSLFGDTPRMFDASFQWWKAYEAAADRPAGQPAGRKGVVIVKRIMLTYGAYPQLQEWDLQVSHDGRVRVLAVTPIFPKGGQWVFYDFHSRLKSLEAPSIP